MSIFKLLKHSKLVEDNKTCKTCRFNCEDDHTSINDCNVGTHYAKLGMKAICYEGELWEQK